MSVANNINNGDEYDQTDKSGKFIRGLESEFGRILKPYISMSNNKNGEEVEQNDKSGEFIKGLESELGRILKPYISMSNNKNGEEVEQNDKSGKFIRGLESELGRILKPEKDKSGEFIRGLESELGRILKPEKDKSGEFIRGLESELGRTLKPEKDKNIKMNGQSSSITQPSDIGQSTSVNTDSSMSNSNSRKEGYNPPPSQITDPTQLLEKLKQALAKLNDIVIKTYTKDNEGTIIYCTEETFDKYGQSIGQSTCGSSDKLTTQSTSRKSTQNTSRTTPQSNDGIVDWMSSQIKEILALPNTIERTNQIDKFTTEVTNNVIKNNANQTSLAREKFGKVISELKAKKKEDKSDTSVDILVQIILAITDKLFSSKRIQ